MTIMRKEITGNFSSIKMPGEDGVRTVAIESVGMPDWCVSDPLPASNNP
jgi:hypothetical protein